jgi:hypothetical protein
MGCAKGNQGYQKIFNLDDFSDISYKSNLLEIT